MIVTNRCREYRDVFHLCIMAEHTAQLLKVMHTFTPSLEKYPGNKLAAAVGGVVGAMLAVVAITAVVVLTVYHLMCGRRKDSIEL